jgi:hypothetical protein
MGANLKYFAVVLEFRLTLAVELESIAVKLVGTAAEASMWIRGITMPNTIIKARIIENAFESLSLFFADIFCSPFCLICSLNAVARVKVHIALPLIYLKYINIQADYSTVLTICQ